MTAFKALQEQNRYIRAEVYPWQKHLWTSVMAFFKNVVFSVPSVTMPWTLSTTTSGTSPSWSTSLVSFIIGSWGHIFLGSGFILKMIHFFLLWCSSLTLTRYSPQTWRDWEETNSCKQCFLIKRAFSFTKRQYLMSDYFVIMLLSRIILILEVTSIQQSLHACNPAQSPILPNACLFFRWKQSDKRSWTPATRRKFCNWLRRKERRDFCRPWPNFISRRDNNNNNNKNLTSRL